MNNIGKTRSGNDKTTFAKVSNQIDIKGAIALAITVASFLLALTLLETSGSNMEAASFANGNDNHPSNANSSSNVLPFLIIGVISFVLFVIIERREKYPLVDFKLMLHKSILPASLIIMLVGFSMFMVFQTIPILVRNPEPLGFGEDAISAGKVTTSICHSTLNLWPYFWVHSVKIRLIKTNHLWYHYNYCRFHWFAYVPFN